MNALHALDELRERLLQADTLTDEDEAHFTAVRSALSPSDAAASWLVWSNEHGAWWRPNRAGYTTFLAGAGRYSEEDAIEICRHARNGFSAEAMPTEIPVRESDVLRCLQSPALTNKGTIA